MACEESVYLALILLIIESLHRHNLYNSNLWFEGYEDQYTLTFFQWKGPIFLGFFFASLAFSFLFVLYFQKASIWSSPTIQSYLPYMYMFDPIGAILIGYGQLRSDFLIFLAGLFVLTNFFMLHVLQRIFAKKKPVGLVSSLFYFILIYPDFLLESGHCCHHKSNHSSHGKFLLHR